MKTIKSIKLRVTPEQHFLYKNDASYQGLSLNTYLINLIQDKVTINQQLYHLHQSITQLKKMLPTAPSQSPPSDSSNEILIEILLMLRSVVNPGNLTMIHSELERLGYKHWSPREQK